MIKYWLIKVVCKKLNSQRWHSFVVHQVLLFNLLLFDKRIHQIAHKPVKSRQDSRTSLFNAGICYFHVRRSFQCFRFLVSRTTGKMVRETDALVCWDVHCLWEFLDPKLNIVLRFRIISIENYNDSLGLLLNCWPCSLSLRVAWIT